LSFTVVSDKNSRHKLVFNLCIILNIENVRIVFFAWKYFIMCLYIWNRKQTRLFSSKFSSKYNQTNGNFIFIQHQCFYV